MQNEGQIQSAQEVNLLDSDLLSFNYDYAGTGQRFLNWLIDNLFMRYVLSYATGVALGTIIAMFNPNLLEGVQDGSLQLWALAYLIGIINYIFYYTLCEKLFNGYTLGKFITGTRAVKESGEDLTLKDALLRSLCRLVPFEVLSGFQIRPWHDQWTNTMVIKSR